MTHSLYMCVCVTVTVYTAWFSWPCRAACLRCSPACWRKCGATMRKLFPSLQPQWVGNCDSAAITHDPLQLSPAIIPIFKRISCFCQWAFSYASVSRCSIHQLLPANLDANLKSRLCPLSWTSVAENMHKHQGCYSEFMTVTTPSIWNHII